MPPKSVKAARGLKMSCKGWAQEAALRMLNNNLDAEVAEKPRELIIYGGSGKAARNWSCYDAIVKSLKTLGNDETLLVQSGKPVGIFRTHDYAPRVLIANSHLVPKWATWENFRDLEDRGLIMYGQMTAGSWIYIGTQGIIQGTYETFAAIADQHFKGDLTGRWILTGGMGGWAAPSLWPAPWRVRPFCASKSTKPVSTVASKSATATSRSRRSTRRSN